MVKVFIVVLNWNRAEDTIECLGSVGQLLVDGYQLSVVVVDNASDDRSVLKIRQYLKRNSAFKMLVNKTNLGYAGGNNVGVRYALEKGADYVLVLNNDALVYPGLVKELVRIAQKDSGIGAISPKIYFAPGFEFHKDRYQKKDWGKVIWAAGGKMDWENVYGSNIGVDEVDHGQFDREAEVEIAVGTAAFYTREVLKKVGIFDEKFFMYYEDTDLSMRIKKAGYKIKFCPRAIVWHKVAQSSGIGGDLNDYYTTRNRMLFGMKYADLRTKIALLRESVKLLLKGRKWQRIGIRDYFLGRLGRGSWQ